MKQFLCWVFCIACTSSVGAQPDPYYQGRASWGQEHADQWALQRVNFTPDIVADEAVVVAVIDTGLDFFHPDLTRDRVWTNVNDPRNGLDDDNNGFVDDGYGWDFVNQDNNPSDDSGHGTHVAGLIAANSNNGIGISGLNSKAKIMVLKAMNFVGYGRASHIAQAIVYAADNGAQVINISLGGLGRTEIEDAAIAYAVDKGVVAVIAAGNLQQDINTVGLAGATGAITVGASGLQDERLAFSNYGVKLDLLAPGYDVLSLRARRTDFAWLTGAEDYKPGSGFVGKLAAYYRATGTSFAAPMVAGAASLILSQNPTLTPAQVKRMVLGSARDIDVPGLDSVSGYGLLDVKASLSADPEFFIDAFIAGVHPQLVNGKSAAVVTGTAQADQFASAQVLIGQGSSPSSWKKVCRDVAKPVRESVLCHMPAAELSSAKLWTVRLVVSHKNGRTFENRFELRTG